MIWTLLLVMTGTNCIMWTSTRQPVQHSSPWRFKYPPYFLPANPTPYQIRGAKERPDIYGKLLSEVEDNGNVDIKSDKNDLFDRNKSNMKNNKSHSLVSFGSSIHSIDNKDDKIKDKETSVLEIPITADELLTEPNDVSVDIRDNLKNSFRPHENRQTEQTNKSLEEIYNNSLPELDGWLKNVHNFNLLHPFSKRRPKSNRIFSSVSPTRISMISTKNPTANLKKKSAVPEKNDIDLAVKKVFSNIRESRFIPSQLFKVDGWLPVPIRSDFPGNWMLKK